MPAPTRGSSHSPSGIPYSGSASGEHMTFAEFKLLAHEMYDSIPPQYVEGIDGLVVEREALPHPALPEIYTLGECRTEQYPSEFGGPGDVRSTIVIFYGSFVRLAELNEDWDWEEELWETITHEVRHHLESLAAEDALEVEDYVFDQNFARREGEPFDPFFYQDGRELGERTFEVDGDVFVERTVTADELAAGRVLFRWRHGTAVVPLPAPLGDLHFVTLEGLPEGPGEVVLVLRRPQSAWAGLRAALGGRKPKVHQSRVQIEAVEA